MDEMHQTKRPALVRSPHIIPQIPSHACTCIQFSSALLAPETLTIALVYTDCEVTIDAFPESIPTQ